MKSAGSSAADGGGPDAIPGELRLAIGSLPKGSWAVGVSGGADSMALLSLLLRWASAADADADAGHLFHVVHLNHQTRGEESDADERFVRDFCAQRKLPCTIASRRQIEPTIARPMPGNPSARYRTLRLALFGQVVAQHRLAGVALAHHADDQAETVFQRLARGAGYLPLGGMSAIARVDELRIVRPLLGVRRHTLRQFLRSIGQPWREDASNASDDYVRNRVRKILAGRDELTCALLELSAACDGLKRWVNAHSRPLEEAFDVRALWDQPSILAEASARAWLAKRGCPLEQLSAAVVARLMEIAQDAATSPRAQFPGAITVCRRRGVVRAEAGPAAAAPS